MATISPQKRSVEFQKKKASKRRKKTSFSLSLNTYTISVILILMIITTCFLYLDQFNDIASQGVAINRLERQRSELIIENEVWNMRIARLKSMDVIEQQDVVYRMPTVDPAEIEFIDLDTLNEDEGGEE